MTVSLKRRMQKLHELMDREELRVRTFAMLTGQLDCPGLEEDMDGHISMRLGQELLDRADSLIEPLGNNPLLASAGKVSRSLVLRLAMVRGLEILEKEHPAKKKRKPRKKARARRQK